MSQILVHGFTTLDGAGRIEALRPDIPGLTVRTVIAGGLAAIVSPVPRRGFFEGRERFALRRLKLHQQVLEAAMTFVPLLPARFETVMPTEARLRTVMDACAGDLRDPLDHYGPLIQVEVVIAWPLSDAMAGLRADGLVGVDTAALHTAETLTHAIQGHQHALTERVRTVLSAVALDVIIAPRFEEDVVANFTILLRRTDEPALDLALQQLDKETGGNLRIRCVGPLPACSFAAVEIGGPRYAEVVQARDMLALSDSLSVADLKRAYHRAISALHPARAPDYAARSRALTAVRDAYALLRRVAEGQMRRAASPAPDEAAVIHLDAHAIEDTVTMRLRRDDDNRAEAA